MGYTLLSTAIFGENIVNAALTKGNQECEDKGIKFDNIQEDLMKSKTLEEFVEKYNKYFEGEIKIQIYKGDNK